MVTPSSSAPRGMAKGAIVRPMVEWLASKYGATVVMLIPARTDTAWWHEYASRGDVRFLRGRVRFLRNGETHTSATKARQSSPFPSAVVVFRPSHHRQDAA